jgi:hypothetical protein
VYAAASGGLVLQYWFYYPFNAFHLLGDHEGDWEHVSVRLDGDLVPLGAWYAQHDENAPGVWLTWADLGREGEHPVVLAARGSHASYARPVDDVDVTCPGGDPATAAALGCVAWRTWDAGTGGVVALGTRARPRRGAEFLRWEGRWGTRTHFAQLGGSPPGPAFQPGWCSAGVPGIAAAPAPARRSVARAAVSASATEREDPREPGVAVWDRW